MVPLQIIWYQIETIRRRRITMSKYGTVAIVTVYFTQGYHMPHNYYGAYFRVSRAML